MHGRRLGCEIARQDTQRLKKGTSWKLELVRLEKDQLGLKGKDGAGKARAEYRVLRKLELRKYGERSAIKRGRGNSRREMDVEGEKGQEKRSRRN